MLNFGLGCSFPINQSQYSYLDMNFALRACNFETSDMVYKFWQKFFGLLGDFLSLCENSCEKAPGRPICIQWCEPPKEDHRNIYLGVWLECYYDLSYENTIDIHGRSQNRRHLYSNMWLKLGVLGFFP